MTGSGTSVSRSIVQRAEALLRSLIGVSRAEVLVRATGGVERVRLVADGGLSSGQIVQNVRSAMLAGLGVPLQPGQIELLDATSWAAAQHAAPPGSADDRATDLPPGAPAPRAEELGTPLPLPGPARAAEDPGTDLPLGAPAGAAGPEPAPPPRLPGPAPTASNGSNGHYAAAAQSAAAARTAGPAAGRINGRAQVNGCESGNGAAHRNGQSNGATHGPPAPGNGAERPGGCAGGHQPCQEAPRGSARDRRSGFRPRPSAGATPATVAPVPEPAPPVADSRARPGAEIAGREVLLERVEVVRQAGRLRCRVVLAAGGDRYSAVADCAEAPLSELQLAARVTCDALRAAELTHTHFEAVTVANLAGGLHVLVALGGWNHGAPVRRSGSAVIRESAEHAAALAVLSALAGT